MPTKVTELTNLKDGNRSSCVICRPRQDRISEDRLWHWAMNYQPLPVKPLKR